MSSETFKVGAKDLKISFVSKLLILSALHLTKT